MSTREVRRRSATAGIAAFAAATWAVGPAAAQTSSLPAPPSPPPSSGLAPMFGDPGAAGADGRYIVVLRKGSSVDDLRAAGNDAAVRGGQVQREYRNALVGFAARLPARALDGVRRNPRVEYVEADAPVTLSQTVQSQSGAPWGLDRVDQRTLPLGSAYTYRATGAGVKAYVVDTGVRSTHTDFQGRVAPGYTAVIDGRGTQDCNGHGTHVAGTIGSRTYGVAKGIQLIPVRTLDCTGSGSVSGIIAGVDWITGDHQPGQPAVANLSLGAGPSTALDNAVANSIADGITYVVAAGNANVDACTTSPARLPAAITIGATTITDARASFSNYGTCLDLFAPGSGITSTSHTSDTATSVLSGTSMAAPHVAGAAALHLQVNPSASPSVVRNAVVSTATPNRVSGAGVGSPNLLAYSLLGDAPVTAPASSSCSLPETYLGSISGPGGNQFQPNGTYFYRGGGTHKGCLRGPSGSDFDLYLQKWNGSAWVTVAQGVSTTPNEDVVYAGTAGYYLWRVDSRAGAGAYTLGLQRP